MTDDIIIAMFENIDNRLLRVDSEYENFIIIRRISDNKI